MVSSVTRVRYHMCCCGGCSRCGGLSGQVREKMSCPRRREERHELVEYSRDSDILSFLSQGKVQISDLKLEFRLVSFPSDFNNSLIKPK